MNGFASSNLPLVRTPQDRAVYIVEAIAGVECDLAVGAGGQCPQPGPSVFPERHPRHCGLGTETEISGTAAAADYPQELTLSINEVVKERTIYAKWGRPSVGGTASAVRKTTWVVIVGGAGVLKNYSATGGTTVADITVDPGGGADYTTLAAAVAAAGPDDWVVFTGEYYRVPRIHSRYWGIRGGDPANPPTWTAGGVSYAWLIRGILGDTTYLQDVHLRGEGNAS